MPQNTIALQDCLRGPEPDYSVEFLELNIAFRLTLSGKQPIEGEKEGDSVGLTAGGYGWNQNCRNYDCPICGTTTFIFKVYKQKRPWRTMALIK